MCRVLVLITFFILINHSIQDIYLHNPRGSNNRLNEKSAQRTNNNRLFDSQVILFFISLNIYYDSFFI